MDSNKDEAVKCMAIGKKAMEEGDKARAVKFLTKSQRLYPNKQVDSYLSALYEGNGKQAADNKADSGDSKSGREDQVKESGLRQRNGVNGSGSGLQASPSGGSGNLGAEATPEQVEIVARIKRTKDYYQILSVTKECSEEDVRKAYRKISLKVHPDKNKAAGAEEAFKAVSRAFMTLSDVELREKYDRFGPEEEQEQQNLVRRRRQQGGNQNPFYEEMFEANDIFNSFFFGMQQQQGGGFRRAHFTRPAGGGGGGGGRQENSNNFLGLLQLLPILALFLFSYFPFSQPVYQLEKQTPYTYLHRTKDNNVQFFVKAEDFNREYPVGTQARRQVEMQVERDYKDVLIHNCRIEQSHYRWGAPRESPHCEKLQRFMRAS